MGRPSKLTEHQWQEVHYRLLKGEKAADLAREFGVSKTRISERFSGRVETVKSVANQILSAETALKALPVTEQLATISLLDDLRAIQHHMAGAGKYSAATSHRVAAIANAKVLEIDDAAPLDGESMDALKVIAALTELSNKAAHIPLTLIAANKETVKELNQQVKPLPQRVTVTVEDASVPDA